MEVQHLTNENKKENERVNKTTINKGKMRSKIPAGVRRLIYTYMDARELYRVSKVSKFERKLLINNKVIVQPRIFKTFKNPL